MRTHLRTALIAACTVGLLALFLRNANLAEVAGEIRNAAPGDLLLALGSTGLTYVLRAWRWQAMLQPIGRVPFALAFRTTVIGFAANTLLPARVGEVLRPYLLARRAGLSATAAFATIVVERALDVVLILALFGAFMFLVEPGAAGFDRTVYAAVKGGGFAAALGAAVGLLAMFVAAGHPDRIGRALQRVERVFPRRAADMVARLGRTFAEGLAVMRRPGPLVASLALSLPLWLSISTTIWLAARAFHITMPFAGSFLVVTILAVGVSVPTPGAVGGFHYAFRIAATAFFAAPNDRAVGAAIVLHAISFVPVAIVGAFFMFQDGLDFTRVRALAGEAGPLGSGPGETPGGNGALP